MDDLDIRLLVDLLRDRITPDKGLGQHFLIDESVVDRSIELANSSLPLSDSKIIEIGPGAGSLTLGLLRAGATVSAFEVDEEAISHLARVFNGANGRLEVFNQDALQADWPENATHVVANIPYQISSPLLGRIQKHHSQYPFTSVVLLVQDEFADRMMNNRNDTASGPLSLSLWLDFDVELDVKVPPHCFSPSPRVSSRLVRLTPNGRELDIDRRLFRTITSHCFANKRRKMRTLLSQTPRRLSRNKGWHKGRWKDAIGAIIEFSPDEMSQDWLNLRPENLKISDWVILSKSISSFPVE
ncbi:MAG: ribosomal RNA small subunit methyltransferase A [Euryarchaeota archaeon]|jgi:16S rRNA (adenine1518-N6/adenine1519-N6)-dimethyltransferase|nr:ribosomal RNA small subunit methyltransferase A [Euryarchaeota archaeon]|tara:strand:- start:2665 stop:3561 length:897 start_codon:yes stop_codon:yes gene_type:complete